MNTPELLHVRFPDIATKVILLILQYLMYYIIIIFISIINVIIIITLAQYSRCSHSLQAVAVLAH